MARFFIAIVALIITSAITPLRAQSSLGERMTAERLAEIPQGSYLAGDSVKFDLAPSGDIFLLRFDGSPEVFVLYPAHVSLGGRELKYDSGQTAMQVAGWGGMTLYTDAEPNGLPAERTGDSAAPSPPVVSLADLHAATSDESEHLAYTRGLRFNFTADWGALANNAAMRSFAFDALQNTVAALDSFGLSAQGREALASHISTVMMAAAPKPTIRLSAKTLIVTFNPERGYEGRASSRAIARALAKVFSKK